MFLLTYYRLDGRRTIRGKGEEVDEREGVEEGGRTAGRWTLGVRLERSSGDEDG